MKNDQLKERIWAISTEFLHQDWFLVDISVAEKGRGKVSVFVDSDAGLNIDDCASFSRRLGDRIEEEALFEGPYKLEVSSPGLDKPLMLARQYIKNIGRDLKIRLTDGRELSGILLSADDKTLTISPKAEKKSKTKKDNFPEGDLTFTYAEIAECKVTVRF